MSKRLLVLILLTLCTASLVARPGSAMDAWRPVSSRSSSMGGTGVASSHHQDVLWANPALVGHDEQFFSLPSLSFTLYNFNKLVEPGGALDIFLEDPWDEEVLNRAVNQLISSIGPGYGDTATLDLGMGFISGITGLGLDGQLAFHSQGGGGEASTLVMEANLAASLALSLPLEFGDHSISFGVGAHFVFRALTVQDMDAPFTEGGITAGGLLDIISQEAILDSLLNQVPVAFGFAVPIDVGLSYKWRDIVTVGAVVSNLNGRYHMESYNGLNQLYHSLTGGHLGSSLPGGLEGGGSFVFDSMPSFDIGFALSSPGGGIWDWIDISAAVDFVDIAGLFMEDALDSEDFISRLRFGFELRLMRTFELRFGLNAGYMAFGLGFDFQVFTLDLAYAVEEYGVRLGDKPLDYLTVAFRLGLED